MLYWFALVIPSLIMTAVCYITNPLVVLFADEDGELHGFWRLWQTWDNSCNPSDLKSVAPKCILFDWDAHYTEYVEPVDPVDTTLADRKRWRTPCHNTSFTAKERFKRYLCRCYWLTRNSCYGWAFYVFGIVPSSKVIITRNENGVLDMREEGGNWANRAWEHKNDSKIFRIGKYELHWKTFLGWKLKEDVQTPARAMIANRIAFAIETVE